MDKENTQGNLYMQFFEEKNNRKTPLDFEETEKSVFLVVGRTTKQKKHFFSMS